MQTLPVGPTLAYREPMAQQPASMQDVAVRAGVSLSTVSRVLREAPGVSAAVRERVLHAAEELSYVVSRNASGLVTGRTGRVAVIAPYLETWFFGTILAGIGATLQDAGLDMLVYQAGTASRARVGWTRSLPLRRNCDAALTVSMDLTPEECELLDDIGVPVILVGQQVQGRASVYIDDRDAAVRATRHLLNLGHERIAYIAGRPAEGVALSSWHRHDGYRQAMAEAGLDEWTTITTPDRRGGEITIVELLSDPRPPTAVLCEFDDIALGVYRALRRARVAVPDDISLMGFDNNDTAAALDLTTVEQSPREIGHAAGRLTIDLLRGEQRIDTHIEMPTRLIPRHSTAAPRTRA